MKIKAAVSICFFGLLYTCSLTAIQANSTAASPQMVNIINQQFGIHVESKEAAQAFMTKQLLICYQRLRQCAPGKYKYIIPDPLATLASSLAKDNTSKNKSPSKPHPSIYPLIIGIYTIEGFQGDKCLFNDTYEMQGSAYLKKCQFHRTSLTAFSDQEAEALAKGNISYKSTGPTPLQKAIQNECEGYLNGQQTAISTSTPNLLAH